MKVFSSERQKNSTLYWLLIGLCSLFLLSACQPITVPAATATALATPLPAAESAYTVVAFVRNGVLYIQTPNAEAVLVEDCAGNACRIFHLTWSPDGAYLLYYWQPIAENAKPELRLTDQQGHVQTVTQNAAFFRPAAWSPAGRQLAYLVNTERIEESATLGGARMMELWTVEVNDGALQNGQQRGEIRFGEGCGGGGRSASAEVYEVEGGFAYGYLAGIMAWSADDIILFSNNCGSRGVGRFDLATGAELEPYPGGLRSLALNATRDQWVAIDEQQQIVLGTPAALDYTPVAAQGAPELVFFGQQSGNLYYTTLTITGTAELVDTVATLDPQIFVSPYFDFTQAELRKIDLATSAETVLTAGHGYAYARATEGAIEGATGLFFARVEDNTELFAAVQEGKLTLENIQELLPTVDVLWLPAAAATPEVWLADAEQFTLAP